MRIYIFIFLVILLHGSCMSISKKSKSVDNEPNVPIKTDSIEIPTYGIKDSLLFNYLNNKIWPAIKKCDSTYLDVSIETHLYLDISDSGKVTNVRVLRTNLSDTCNNEIIKLIYEMDRWIPAKKWNQNISSSRVLIFKTKTSP